jgi:hypothetical protein
VAIAAGSVGVASLLVGAFFGVRATSRWGDAKDGCATPPTGCSHDAVTLGQDANRDATIATVAVTIGVVGLGAGTWLWFGSGGNEPAHIVVGGRF